MTKTDRKAGKAKRKTARKAGKAKRKTQHKTKGTNT